MSFISQPDGEDLTPIAEWMTERKVNAVIYEGFNSEEAEKAIERLKTSQAKGEGCRRCCG